MSDALWEITETGERVSEKDDFMKARRKYATQHNLSFDDFIMTRNPVARAISFRPVESINDLNDQIALLSAEVEAGEQFTLEVSRPETILMITVLFGLPGPGYRSDFAPFVRFKANEYRTKCLAIDDSASLEKCDRVGAMIGQCRHVHGTGSDFHVVWIMKQNSLAPITNDDATKVHSDTTK